MYIFSEFIIERLFLCFIFSFVFVLDSISGGVSHYVTIGWGRAKYQYWLLHI